MTSQHDDANAEMRDYCYDFVEKLSEHRKHLDGGSVAQQICLAVEKIVESIGDVFAEDANGTG